MRILRKDILRDAAAERRFVGGSLKRDIATDTTRKQPRLGIEPECAQQSLELRHRLGVSEDKDAAGLRAHVGQVQVASQKHPPLGIGAGDKERQREVEVPRCVYADDAQIFPQSDQHPIHEEARRLEYSLHV